MLTHGQVVVSTDAASAWLIENILQQVFSKYKYCIFSKKIL